MCTFKNRLTRCAGVMAAVIFAGSLAAQQPAEECGPAVGPGTQIPAGYHAHQHGDHYHLCRPAPQAAAQAQARPQPNPAAIAYLQQRLRKAEEDYQSCLRDRASMTSGVIRMSMNCEGWQTLIQQLQADIRRAQGW